MQIRKRYGDEIAVIMISSNEQHEMVEACIRAGADSYLFKPLRIADFSNIWQFVMQQRCHKLHAERREMRYLRNQQLARMKQIQAEKARAIALADADREKAQREQARPRQHGRRPTGAGARPATRAHAEGDHAPAASAGASTPRFNAISRSLQVASVSYSVVVPPSSCSTLLPPICPLLSLGPAPSSLRLSSLSPSRATAAPDKRAGPQVLAPRADV